MNQSGARFAVGCAYDFLTRRLAVDLAEQGHSHVAIAAQLELDNRGLLWTQTQPPQPEDVLALMKALPSLSLPFEFPVKL